MDPLRLETKIAMFGVVAMHWMLAVAIPAFIFGHIQPPPQEGWAVVLLSAAIVGYCIYTGYRAWKRGSVDGGRVLSFARLCLECYLCCRLLASHS